MAAPLYRQIADDLHQQIEAGTLASGSQLPTVQDLCDRYGASRNTARDAIGRLISLGLVETRPGRGTFVRHIQERDGFVTTLAADPASGFSGSYLRGELSGSFSLRDRITLNTVAITGAPDQGFWQQAIRTGYSNSHELPRQARKCIDYQSFAKFSFQAKNVALMEDDYVLSALSTRQRNATLLLILYSEEHAKLQAAAIARMLAMIFVVATAIFWAVRSIFRFTTAIVIIVRTLMAHRNSREPAYCLTSYLPLYQSLAGILLA
jgi:DNA-binding transcriptional MocR family regulator